MSDLREAFEGARQTEREQDAEIARLKADASVLRQRVSFEANAWQAARQELDERDAEIARLRADRAAAWRAGVEAALAAVDDEVTTAEAAYRLNPSTRYGERVRYYSCLADEVRAALAAMEPPDA